MMCRNQKFTAMVKPSPMMRNAASQIPAKKLIEYILFNADPNDF